MQRRRNGLYAWIGILVIAILVIIVIALAATHGTSSPSSPPPSRNLEISVRPGSTLFPFNGRLYFTYELLLLNLPQDPLIDILALQIFDASNHQPLRELKDPPVHFFYENNTRIQETQLIKALIYVFIDFPAGTPLPLALSHIIITATEQIIVSEPLVFVPRGLSPVIGSPFKEGRTWFVAGGPAADSLHRITVLPTPDQLFLAETYAIDWVSLNEENRAYLNNGTLNSDWDCYNRELVAVADGIVISIQDGLPENVPNTKPVIDINGSTIAGNSIVLQIGPDLFVYYAHLVPGSLLVSPEQSVSKGQVLARLGNSGNSGAPHLHLQVSNGSSLLASESVAYVFERFRYLGMTDIAAVFNGGNALSSFVFVPNQGEQLRRDELPLQYSVLSFETV